MQLNYKKISVVIMIAVLLSTLAATLFISTATAAVTVNEITGKLGGADYRIRIPSNWESTGSNLVIYCRGYSHTVPTSFSATAFLMLLGQGYIVAESSYGVGGYCVQEGMIRTHQLTEYILDHYAVTGKVLLMGISIGGNIALQLGAKYPDLYNCVLYISGSKDLSTQYDDKIAFAALTDDSALQAALIAKGSASTPYPFKFPYNSNPALGYPYIYATLNSALNDFRSYCTVSANDIKLACGGNTPQEKMKAYEKISPTFSASDLKIPTITIHGDKDGLVPYSQSLGFKATVQSNGDLDLYRLYTVINGEHANPSVTSKIPICMPYLLNWVENGVPAPATMVW